MAHVLANVCAAILTRLPDDLKPSLFAIMSASALDSVEDVVSSHPGEVKQQVRTLTRVYVMAALKEVARELRLEAPDPGAGNRPAE
jgi:hypothetical protein